MIKLVVQFLLFMHWDLWFKSPLHKVSTSGRNLARLTVAVMLPVLDKWVASNAWLSSYVLQTSTWRRQRNPLELQLTWRRGVFHNFNLKKPQEGKRRPKHESEKVVSAPLMCMHTSGPQNQLPVALSCDLCMVELYCTVNVVLCYPCIV